MPGTCCTARSAPPLDPCDPTGHVWPVTCSAQPLATTLSRTAVAKVVTAGPPSLGAIARARPNSKIHDANAATAQESVGPLLEHNVAKTLPVARRIANKAIAKGSPFSAKYP